MHYYICNDITMHVYTYTHMHMHIYMCTVLVRAHISLSHLYCMLETLKIKTTAVTLEAK